MSDMMDIFGLRDQKLPALVESYLNRVEQVFRIAKLAKEAGYQEKAEAWVEALEDVMKKMADDIEKLTKEEMKNE